MVGGEGPGHVHPGQRRLGRQTAAGRLPDQAVGVKAVGRVHHQDRRPPGYPPGGRGCGQGSQVSPPEQDAPARLQGRQVVA